MCSVLELIIKYGDINIFITLIIIIIIIYIYIYNKHSTGNSNRIRKKEWCKLMNALTRIVLTSVLLIVILGSGCLDDPNYAKGYLQGYKEHNVTKYNAAQVLIAPGTIGLQPSAEQMYASGYCKGWEDIQGRVASKTLDYNNSNLN